MQSENKLLQSNLKEFVRLVDTDVIRVRPSDRDILMELLTNVNVALAETGE